jgi:phage-related protein
MKYFETRFMEEADEFIKELNPKIIKKIFYNIDLAEQTNDPDLFKKLRNDIWEFRTKYFGQNIRLLAFWDKSDKQKTLVISTHGFIKKVDKINGNEISRAEKLRTKYFLNKSKNQSND